MSRSADLGADLSDNVTEIERLADDERIVRGRGSLVTIGGHHDKATVRRDSSKLAQQERRVAVVQAGIEHDGIRVRPNAGEQQCLRACRGGVGCVPGLTQAGRQRPADERFIVHDQDAAGRICADDPEFSASGWRHHEKVPPKDLVMTPPEQDRGRFGIRDSGFGMGIRDSGWGFAIRDSGSGIRDQGFGDGLRLSLGIEYI